MSISLRTLLLNSSGEFLGVVPWQSAVGDMIVGHVKVLREYDFAVKSEFLNIRVPAVVRQNNFVKVHYEHIFYIAHSKHNVFIRDKHTCQYCGYQCTRRKFGQEELMRKPKLYQTLPEMDHVHPRSKGGVDSWENTVTACRRCNNRKGHLSLKEAGMKLLSQPKKPEGFRDIFEMKIGQIHELWYDFLQLYFD